MSAGLRPRHHRPHDCKPGRSRDFCNWKNKTNTKINVKYSPEKIMKLNIGTKTRVTLARHGALHADPSTSVFGVCQGFNLLWLLIQRPRGDEDDKQNRDRQTPGWVGHRDVYHYGNSIRPAGFHLRSGGLMKHCCVTAWQDPRCREKFNRAGGESVTRKCLQLEGRQIVHVWFIMPKCVFRRTFIHIIRKNSRVIILLFLISRKIQPSYHWMKMYSFSLWITF